MDWTNAVPVVQTLAAVFLGWALNEWSSRSRAKRESKRDRNLIIQEMLLENYAEWTAGMEAGLVRYATQSIDGSTAFDVPRSEKRLLLLECDAESRKFIHEIKDAIPGLLTEDFADLQRHAHADPEWDWKPFRVKMDGLLERVRQRMTQ